MRDFYYQQFVSDPRKRGYSEGDLTCCRVPFTYRDTSPTVNGFLRHGEEAIKLLVVEVTHLRVVRKRE